MNEGAIALRGWRGDLASAAGAQQLVISAPLYERIEAGEVIPEPWLRAMIASATGGLVAADLWDGSPAAKIMIGSCWEAAPSVMILRRGGGHWVRIDAGDGVLSLPIEQARLLSGGLTALFGVIDEAAGVLAASGAPPPNRASATG